MQPARAFPLVLALIAGLAPAGPAAAQDAAVPGDAPAALEVWTAMAVSDTTQMIGTGAGSSAVEARTRAKLDCKASDCVSLLATPIKGHCLGMAINPKPVPGVRAVFAVATTDAASAGSQAQAACVASGTKGCVTRVKQCF